MTQLASFAVGIEYGQLAAFDGRLEAPFNNWTDRHVAQGFAWRPGSVSFMPLSHSGLATVVVKRATAFRPSKKAARVIAVPFSVTAGMPVEIGSVSTPAGAHVIDLPVGEYRLCFETGSAGDDCWVRFTFVPGSHAAHEVLLADSRLSPTYPLLTEATPA